jgi:hypothetical protein
MNKEITHAEKYNSAMKITDQGEADLYFEECVQHTMSWGSTREEAEQIEKSNLGYWAGYYSHETRVRVERLFRCVHPFLGRAEDGQLGQSEIIEIGIKAAKDSFDVR